MPNQFRNKSKGPQDQINLTLLEMLVMAPTPNLELILRLTVKKSIKQTPKHKLMFNDQMRREGCKMTRRTQVRSILIHTLNHIPMMSILMLIPVKIKKAPQVKINLKSHLPKV